MFTSPHSLSTIDWSGSGHLTTAGPTTTFPKSVGFQGDESTPVPSIPDKAVGYKPRSHQLTFLQCGERQSMVREKGENSEKIREERHRLDFDRVLVLALSCYCLRLSGTAIVRVPCFFHQHPSILPILLKYRF